MATLHVDLFPCPHCQSIAWIAAEETSSPREFLLVMKVLHQSHVEVDESGAALAGVRLALGIGPRGVDRQADEPAHGRSHHTGSDKRSDHH